MVGSVHVIDVSEGSCVEAIGATEAGAVCGIGSFVGNDIRLSDSGGEDDVR